MDAKKSIKSNFSVITGLFITLVLISFFIIISFTLSSYFDRIHADEPVVFASLAGLLLLMLTIISFHWFRHRLRLLSVVQGAVLFSCIAFPFFRKEPGSESIAMTIFAFILGGVIATGLIGVLKSILRSASLNRPISVAVVGWLIIISSLLATVIAFVATPRLTPFLIAVFAFHAIIGSGILYGWNWCRWTYFVVGGLALFLSLRDIGIGTILGFLLYPVIVLILTRPKAKDFFSKTRTSSLRKER